MTNYYFKKIKRAKGLNININYQSLESAPSATQIASNRQSKAPSFVKPAAV